MAILRVHCAGHGWLTIAADGTADARYRFAVSSGILPEFSVPVARDLLRIGQAAFLADRAFRRSLRLGQRTRDLQVVVPVEDPTCWTNLAESVTGLAGFVSHDRWQFEFVRLRQGSARRLVGISVPSNACISLFSGGLDSLCGAAAALRRGEIPILVTHSPPGIERVSASIAKLRNELGLNGPEPLFVGFNFQASDRTTGGTRNLFPERTRRTRPMLYLCLAGAVALECQVHRIYLNENGTLAINLPFQPHLNGPLVSRHAHPETLRRFESLLKKVWEGPEAPTVTNPFATQTKGEQISSLGPARLLARETISCEYAGQQVARLIAWLRDQRRMYRDVRECGLCFPCLVRRAAMSFADVPEGRDHYVFDVRRCLGRPNSYRDYPLYAFLEANARDLRRFCETMLLLDPSDFVLRYAAQLALVAADTATVSRTTYDLYQRFARQVNSFLVAK